MMSDQIMNRFRAQLTTAMDSALRSAVFEVMTIFENTLHDHQMQMAQKGEEVAQLKIKLQTAELRLKDLEESGLRRVETTQTQTETKALLDALKPTFDALKSTSNSLKPTSEVHEIDVDEPDDWCAPLGCEVVTKEEDAGCPSVRLRQFSIPLWHVPIRKHEELNSNPMCTTGGRRTQRLSALNAKSKLIQSDKRTGLGSQSTPVRNDMKRLMQDMTSVYPDLSRSGGFRSRRLRKHFKQKEQKMHKEERNKSTAVQSKSDKVTKVEKKKCKYVCKFCFRVFDTEYGLITHVIIHKKCVDCNKIFRYPSVLNIHRQHCPKLKNAVQKNPSDTSDSSSDEEIVPCKTQRISVEEDSKTSTKKDDLSTDLVRSHTLEPWYTCRICLKKCYNRHSLAVHMGRKHNKRLRSLNINTDVTWTKPLEENSVSHGKDTSTHDKGRNISHQEYGTVGVRGPEGFSCVICKKILKSKVGLIDHFCIHTGEKPFYCKMSRKVSS